MLLEQDNPRKQHAWALQSAMEECYTSFYDQKNVQTAVFVFVVDMIFPSSSHWLIVENMKKRKY